MRSVPIHREITSIIASIIFLLLGLAAVWLGKSLIGLEGEIIYIALALVPILAYVIFSGRLNTLRGPGGLEAKFSEVGEQSVDLDSEAIETSEDDMQVIAKGGIRDLQSKIESLDESKPIILALAMGRTRSSYDQVILADYLEALSGLRAFKFVVILDQQNKFVAYLPASAMVQVLKNQALGSAFVVALNADNIAELRRFPGVITKTISISSSNLRALREMTSQNVDALVVIDGERNLKGVVEREQIISKLLIGLTN